MRRRLSNEFGRLSNYFSENEQEETSLAAVWEALKLVVRGDFISIAAAFMRLRKEKRAELEGEVKELETLHKRTGAPRGWRELETRRRMLKHLDLDRAEHALLWLRHKFYLSGDKSGKMLAHRLRAHTQISSIQAIRDHNSVEHITDAHIVENGYTQGRLPLCLSRRLT